MAKKEKKPAVKKVKPAKTEVTEPVKSEDNEGRPGNTLPDGRPYRGH